MRHWFPFTDYDFYAYLTAGMFFIAVVDYTFGQQTLINRDQWTVVEIIFWTAAAYVAGQLIAGPSALVLEEILARRVFYPPVTILLGLKRPRLRERLVGAIFVGRYYRPFSMEMRTLLLARAAKAHKANPASFKDAEATFQVAFAYARTIPDTAARIDQFRNLYGFNRNLAFVALLAVLMFAARTYLTPSHETTWLLFIAALVAVGAFGRFIKFYFEFAAEVLRVFSFESVRKGVT